MHLYDVVLFIHLTGVALLVAGVGLEVVGLACAPRARFVGQLRGAMFGGQFLPKLMPAAVVIIVAAGLWLVGDSSEISFRDTWVDTALTLTVILTVVGITVTGKRMEHLGKSALEAPDGPVTPELVAMANDPLTQLLGWNSVTLVGTLLFLMTNKPGPTGTAVAVVVGLAAGTVASVVARRPVVTAVPAEIAATGAATS